MSPYINRNFWLFLLIACSSTGYASHSPIHWKYFSLTNPDSSGIDHVARAAEMCQYGRLVEAKSEIELAMQTDDAEKAYSWYVKGFVFKEIFKSSSVKTEKSIARDEAVDAFMNARSLSDYDPAVFNADAPMKYLIGTFYSDALMEAGSCTTESLPYCDQLMAKFSDHAAYAGLDADLKIRKADFNKTVAMRFFHLWQQDIASTSLYDLALNRMSSAIADNPGDCMSMYNIAVFHFKMAEAGKQGKLNCDHEGELDIALSEMHKAESTCSGNEDILRGILNIYKMKQDETMMMEYEMKIAGAQQNPLIKN